ncbi:hypothetical protein N7468_002781 [Penicillium chermesinum]|uniref:Copper transport protein n=1 Tax=Penicillium chermesinum TaxID=63820 RepID=A0A9W9PLB1_9EURO|nr:uncharacterized protein N7468_002781 [Penicillium chermesinum]KAJ5247798.1 hypothetical protein N7468_002781 [Penicillium chermesinum]
MDDMSGMGGMGGMGGMATSTMSMATATMTSGMSMATSTGSSMHMGSGMSMSMSDMAMTFFTSFKTPLYSDDWTPSSEGHYAGTCIFLIVLAVILRVLLALRPIFEGRLWTDGIKHSMDDHIIEEPMKRTSGVRQSFQEIGRRWSRWRVNPAAGRATYELFVAGIAYLL